MIRPSTPKIISFGTSFDFQQSIKVSTVFKEDAETLLKDIAENIEVFLNKKVEAVKVKDNF